MPSKLLVTVDDGALRIDGLADCDEAMCKLAGSYTSPGVIRMSVKQAAEQLDNAIARAAVCGKAEGSTIKFAHPIYVEDGGKILQRVGKSTKIDDSVYTALKRAIEALDSPEHIKSAINDFNERLIQAIEDAKVDGHEVGINVPIKIAFADTRARDMFLSAAKKKPVKAAADRLADQLEKMGFVVGKAGAEMTDQAFVDVLIKAAYAEGLQAGLELAAAKEATRKGHKLTPGSLKGGKSEPAAKAPAGEGARFKALKRKISGKVKNPGAVAAAIGRAKFGKKKFQQMAARGRKAAAIAELLKLVK